MDRLQVVSLVPLSDRAQGRIEAIDSSVEVRVAANWFDGELRETWGDHVADGYLPKGSAGIRTRAERDALLAGADVVLAGFPMLPDLRERAPKLRWVHQTPAGASNLLRCDLWGSDIVVTTSRGLGNTLAIAEYVVAMFAMFARDLHRPAMEKAAGRFDRSSYRPIQLAGKTVCVVGAGGIGADVGRLCSALGMRVVGTRRNPGVPVPGFDLVAGPDQLLELLAESQFVAVCCQWTPETEGLISQEALAVIPDGAALVNVARGEVIDETALTTHLDRFRGVGLDVFVGEFDGPPRSELWDHPNVVVTPHVSAGSDQRSARPLELFERNLAALIKGDPLDNIVDWERGY
jgi:phosphoglycerate dehydrogenase-like enzyme